MNMPDVVIVDLQMPVMDGTETSAIILQKYPDVKIIILTMHDSSKFILHMMDMGVHAFLLKNTEPDELEKAIYAVADKDFYHNDLVVAVLRKNVNERKNGSTTNFSSRRIDRARERNSLAHLSGTDDERDRATFILK